MIVRLLLVRVLTTPPAKMGCTLAAAPDAGAADEAATSWAAFFWQAASAVAAHSMAAPAHIIRFAMAFLPVS